MAAAQVRSIVEFMGAWSLPCAGASEMPSTRRRLPSAVLASGSAAEAPGGGEEGTGLLPRAGVRHVAAADGARGGSRAGFKRHCHDHKSLMSEDATLDAYLAERTSTLPGRQEPRLASGGRQHCVVLWCQLQPVDVWSLRDWLLGCGVLLVAWTQACPFWCIRAAKAPKLASTHRRARPGNDSDDSMYGSDGDIPAAGRQGAKSRRTCMSGG